METIAFVTQKGGAGKTTVAASLAVAAQQDGETVAILDLDPQQSLMDWGNDREEETPAIDQVSADMVNQLPEILKRLEANGYTLVVLDTAGVDNASTHMAMQSADLTLIPARPTKVDLRATQTTVKTAFRMEKPFLFVLNQCSGQPRNMRAGEASTGLAALGNVAKPLLVERVDHQDAFASGLGITEYAPTSAAAKEMKTLWQSVKKTMKGNKNGKQAA